MNEVKCIKGTLFVYYKNDDLTRAHSSIVDKIKLNTIFFYFG